MIKTKSLFGEDFDLNNIEKEKNKKVLSKILPSQIDSLIEDESNLRKTLNSKSISLESKIELISKKVIKVLGHYKKYTQVIKTREELHSYIDEAIKNNLIAIDTETNNSLDPLTCKLMGGCIYTPGQKNAYIPINHTDLGGNRLDWQLTEQDIKEEFSRLNNNDDKVKILTHNGKFDYKVLHCTCGWDMSIYWDSYCAARLLDENEPSAGLKQQYIDKVDPSQEKYSIDYLFEDLPYAVFDPEIFAYYAATDAYMTYKLYEWQLKRFENNSDSLKGVYHILTSIEIPLIEVVAKMELEGINIDREYANRLSIKYHKLFEECNNKIEEELQKYSSQIEKWRLTPEANLKPKNKKGNGFGKSKNEQLEDPLKISSPTQLSILLYDVLKMPQVSTKSPRGTGVDELTSLYRKTNSKLCSLILEMRGLDKLLNTFIDKLPNSVNPKDLKVHCEFLPLGTDTGRFSSSNPNLQQIPRSNIEIKPMFKAPGSYEEEITIVENPIKLKCWDEVESLEGWKKVRDLKIGDIIKGDVPLKIKNLKIDLDSATIYF